MDARVEPAHDAVFSRRIALGTRESGAKKPDRLL
jgi:hypothetical protein